MMENNLLPIGSVVLVKNSTKKAFIVGFRGQTSEDETKIYDYIGYPYPEGFVTRNLTLMFNNSDIEKVYYMGYNSEEEQEFKNDLYEYIKEKSGVE